MIPTNKDPGFILTTIKVIQDFDLGLLIGDYDWSSGISNFTIGNSVYFSPEYQELRWVMEVRFLIKKEALVHKTSVCFRISNYSEVIKSLPNKPYISKWSNEPPLPTKVYSVPYFLYHKSLDATINIVRGILASKGVNRFGEAQIVITNPNQWRAGEFLQDEKIIVIE